MEELKRFEDLCEYDDNFKTNNDLKNYYNEIKEINLNKNVPKQIKIGFINALHLLIYSMYYRNFNTIAKEQALITLEYALKNKIRELCGCGCLYDNCKYPCSCKACDKKPNTLRPLLQWAVDNKLISLKDIKDEDIPSTYQEQQKQGEKFAIECMKEIPDNNDYYNNDDCGEYIDNSVVTKGKIKNKDMNDTQKIERICGQRNQLAHNTEPSFVDGEKWVRTCAKLINWLYPC